MSNRPEIRTCIIPNPNTKILDLALDPNDQDFVLNSLRECASHDNRAELQIDTNIENNIKKATVPIALRKRAMCDRLDIIKTQNKEPQENKIIAKQEKEIEPQKNINIEIIIKNPMPIMRRKFLLYQWSLAG